MATWMKTRDPGGLSTKTTISIVLLSISVYNIIELFFIVFWTFKRYSGLYFWSFLMSMVGIAISFTTFLIQLAYPPANNSVEGYAICTWIWIGWVLMVTGQSLVLYSRLHLVLQDPKRLKIVLGMIITNGILVHGTFAPILFGTYSSHPEIWAQPSRVVQILEVTSFFVQEFILSGLYIIEAAKFIKLKQCMGNVGRNRRLMKQLILINVVIILLDALILMFVFSNLNNYTGPYRRLAYSIKLKLEFTILNRLVEVATPRRDISFNPTGDASSQIASTPSLPK